MTRESFDNYCHAHAVLIDSIRAAAWALHDSVNQTYDGTLPYGHHLSMVANAAMEYGSEVVESEHDILPIVFAAYFHDSIEDARQTYNDVMRTAQCYMDMQQALIATEIVYALTNDKGRTRAERAGRRYYEGIRSTPYAPLIKLCDRYANMSYSRLGSDESNIHMQSVYASEWEHFISEISTSTADVRFHLPKRLIDDTRKMIE